MVVIVFYQPSYQIDSFDPDHPLRGPYYASLEEAKTWFNLATNATLARYLTEGPIGSFCPSDFRILCHRFELPTEGHPVYPDAESVWFERDADFLSRPPTK
jgi:hypothetical protein